MITDHSLYITRGVARETEVAYGLPSIYGIECHLIDISNSIDLYLLLIN